MFIQSAGCPWDLLVIPIPHYHCPAASYLIVDALDRIFRKYLVNSLIVWCGIYDMSSDGPYKCTTCNGKEFGSREELDKHTREEHATSTL